MPKKTRREKILAELHRKTYEPPVASPTPQYAFQSITAQPQPIVAEDMAEYRAIKFDLIKTLTLAALAISVELLLYYKIGR